MRIKGVRRLPVVNELGELQSILSADDLLEQLSDIVALVSKEITNEVKSRK